MKEFKYIMLNITFVKKHNYYDTETKYYTFK